MENNERLVSVIIPFLNMGAWLREAIDSVLAQTYTHWELILFDDGSEDTATNIAKAYQKKYKDKIIYLDHVQHNNLGVSKSRNAGVEKSRGSLIAFLDSDDKWLPDKLLHQLDIFKNNPATALICESSVFWYSWASPQAADILYEVGAPKNKLYAPRQLTSLLYPLGEGAPPCPTGLIITREAFYNNGGFEPSFCSEYELYEDQAFLCKIYLNENVYVSSQANNLYRKRNNSMSSSGHDPKHYKKVRLYFLEWMENYMHTHQITDAAITALIGQAKKADAILQPGITA